MGRSVMFSDLEQPHGDSLTLFRCRLVADDLLGSCSVDGCRRGTAVPVTAMKAANPLIESIAKASDRSLRYVDLRDAKVRAAVRGF